MRRRQSEWQEEGIVDASQLVYLLFYYPFKICMIVSQIWCWPGYGSLLTRAF